MTRRCDRIRLSASQSFTPSEIDALYEVLSGILVGRDMRFIGRSPVVSKLAKKAIAMRATVARKRVLREDLASEIGRPDPARVRSVAVDTEIPVEEPQPKPDGTRWGGKHKWSRERAMPRSEYRGAKTQ